MPSLLFPEIENSGNATLHTPTKGTTSLQNYGQDGTKGVWVLKLGKRHASSYLMVVDVLHGKIRQHPSS